MHIASLPYHLIPSAKQLVDSIFPKQNLTERLSFWFYPRRNTLLVKCCFAVLGVKELIDYWVAIDEPTQRVTAIAGLYTYWKDYQEAVWLGWFCVAPEARGTGLGSKVLDFAIAQATASGKKFLRLYTSTDLNEAAAQHLYEKKGFRLVEAEPQGHVTILYRQREL